MDLYTEALSIIIIYMPVGISLNKQKLVYDILTPSIIAIYKFLWTYGGSEHNIYMPVAYKGLILIDHQ